MIQSHSPLSLPRLHSAVNHHKIADPLKKLYHTLARKNDAYEYAWCDIRQQSSEEPCDETSFGGKKKTCVFFRFVFEKDRPAPLFFNEMACICVGLCVCFHMV